MDGYLLDTNIISYYYDKGRPEHGAVTTHIEGLPEKAPLRVSEITLGEISYGYHLAGLTDGDLPASQLRARADFPKPLPVSRHTADPYGQIRAILFRKCSPKRKRGRPVPEELIDPTTGKELGVQENDIWLVAQAQEHNLVLVTHDKKMKRIKDACNPEMALRFEDWAE